MSASDVDAAVGWRVQNGVGAILLNRPRAINSLNQEMVDILGPLLARWADDDKVSAVLVDGAGERGLCAGGDVIAMYHSARAAGPHHGVAARKFWHDEYRLNAQIAEFGKPYVALMDGIVMGGGVGVSAHGSIRVVTDRSSVGMPEVGIGFVPDVGGTYLLSRAPGLLGLHAALTGAPFDGADAIAMGFADHFVPHARLDDLRAALTAGNGSDIAQVVAEHAVAPPPSPLLQQRGWIDECYAAADVAGILAALRGHGCEPAAAAANLIDTRSPTSLAVTLVAVRRAATLPTLRAVLRQEFRTAVASLQSPDLVEGIRAQLVDKDRNPQWSPRSTDTVGPANVEQFFAPANPDLSFEGVSQ